MKARILSLIALLAAGAFADAIAIRLNPGLSAPDIADGARLEAAVLVSPARFLVTGDPVTLIFTR